VWVGSSDLKSLFPRLFSLSLNQGQAVGDVGVWSNSEWRWSLTWRRAIFVWESSMEADLFTLLSGEPMKRNDADVQVWGKEVPGLFSVNSAYECLAKQSRGPQSKVFKLLWKAKAFPNVIATAWRVLLGRIPTRVCLSRRRVMMDSTLCAMCQVKEESCQHPFLECKCAQRVWSLCFKWIGISFVQQNDLNFHFLSFYLSKASNKQNLVWKGVWASIIRCIWDQRNLIVFKQGLLDAEEVFQKA